MKPEREQKPFWFAGDSYVRPTIGYKCNEYDWWWCPSEGVSCCEGTSLFATREEALAKVRADITAKIATLATQLSKLK